MHINELFSLDGHCAVVIGGAGKVGLPMAEALAEAGATVYIGSRSEKSYQPEVDRLKSLGLKVFGITIDQSDEDCVIKVIEMEALANESKIRVAIPTMPFIPGPAMLNITMSSRFEMPLTLVHFSLFSELIKVPGALGFKVFLIRQGI